MAYTPTILAFAGSLRTGSFNKKLVKIAAEGARAAGASVTYADLRDFPMPVYDADDEQAEGLPESAVKFKQLMLAHDGFLISSPEYNSSIPGGLKNVFDWASRAAPGEPELACFVGKVAVLMSASPGRFGGMRALVHVRAMLGNIHTLVLPDTMSIPLAHQAFRDDGRLTEPRQQAAIERLGAVLASTLAKLKA
jgi:NAD(P)H-dependent FMN reductase